MQMPKPRDLELAGKPMNIGRLLEVGVAVSDLDLATRTFVRLLGVRATAPIRAPMFAMDFSMCRLGDVDFELMTPHAPGSIVNRFIEVRGEGLHHVAFQVPDIDETIARCRSRGLPVLSSEPVLLGGLRAAFLHPGCLSGLLVEFVENLHTWRTIVPDGDTQDRTNAQRISGFGVVVTDVDAAAASYSKILGAELSAPHWNEMLDGRACYAVLNGVRFELIASTASRIDPARLSHHRQGLHHVCLEVLNPEAFSPRGDRDGIRGRTDMPFLTDPAACHGVAFEIRRAPG